MADLFLSYSREDAVRAGQVATALEAEGFDVFWDKEIPAGQTWADFIEDKLTNSHAVVVLWSEISTKSQWVREEARMGRDKGKLIPVQLDGAMPPFGFGEVQAANLASWQGDRSSPDWQRLVGAIRFAIEKAGQTPPAPRPVAPPPAPKPKGFQAPGSGPAAPIDEAKKGGIKPIWWIGGGIAALVVLGLIGAVTNSGQGSAPAPAYSSAQSSNAVSQSAAPAGLPANVRAIVDEAVAAEQAGRAASEQAAEVSAQAYNAAAVGVANQSGFAAQQMPDGSVIAGDITGLVAGEAAAVGVSNPTGLQFYGLYQQLNQTDYTMNGSASWGALNASGQWAFAGTNYDFIGRVAINGRFNGAARESGSTAQSEGAGVGVFTFADGRRYAGQYRAVGEGPQGQVFMHGLGALYAANGDLMNAGRFDNDRYVGPE